MEAGALTRSTAIDSSFVKAQAITPARAVALGKQRDGTLAGFRRAHPEVPAPALGREGLALGADRLGVLYVPQSFKGDLKPPAKKAESWRTTSSLSVALHNPFDSCSNRLASATI